MAAPAWIEASLPVASALLRGFRIMHRQSWEDEGVREALSVAALASMSDRRRLLALHENLEQLCRRYPELRVFWKDADSVYLGSTASFARDAGVLPDALIGARDTDEAIAFSRQGAKYQRDDRRVMDGGQPLLAFLERQDTSEGTHWLLTSKVPLMEEGRAVGILGAYDVITAERASQLRREGHRLS